MYFSISRRQFLKHSGACTLALAASPLYGLAKHRPLITFGVVTDSHYADRDVNGIRHYRQSIGKMEEAMREMNARKTDFVVHLGDFKDQADTPDEQSTLAFLKEIEKAFATYRGPRYHVLGNHDNDSISKQQFLQHVENTGIAKDRSYYSFDDRKIHFIVLDGNFTKQGVPYDSGNFHWTDSFIPEAQLVWLESDLRQTRLPVIVFVHQLLDNVESEKHCVQNAEAVRRILDASGKVLGVFQGHRHADRYNKLNDIHYCTLPAMVDYAGLDNNSFSIVEVYRDGLNMIGYKRAASREMAVG